MTKHAYVIGTCDTKGEELRYLRDRLRDAGVATCLVDVGTRSRDEGVDVTSAQVAEHGPDGSAFLHRDQRGEAVTEMSEALAAFLRSRDDVGGVIGAGGSGNTSIVTHGMQVLPVGVPKVMISTMACGDIASYMGGRDICMLYAVTDIAGLNSISRAVLANGAHALAGMMANTAPAVESDKPAVALTMFGVTTPCVTQVRQKMEDGYDCLVFHATRAGRASIKALTGSRMLRGVMDLTTTQVAIFTEGKTRRHTGWLDAVAETRMPFVGSLGAQDMVNFGAPETIPAHLKHRLFYRHNAFATLMRTSRDECAAIGHWLGEQLNRLEGPARFLLPEGGVSMIDAPGQPFWDPEADAALFESLGKTFKATVTRQLARLPHHINDAAFAEAAVVHFQDIAG